MKTSTLSLWAVCVLASIWVLSGGSKALAQEDELQMALKMQDDRIKGLTALAEKIKNFNFLSISQGVMKKLESRDQKQDPFGMAMDPEDELPEMSVPDEGLGLEEGEEVMRTSLQEALTKLNITGAIPQRKTIMIGAQELGVGDEIAIQFKETIFNLKILAITSSELKLRDEETQEEASVQIGFSNALPAGMSRQAPKITAEDQQREQTSIVPMSNRSITVE
ncbi:MAG: hypothetical protein KDM64_03280 [Verrucomicrobiae bacterium]|nr:hypothetical protein [Verrucomicrobiae bacterium]